MVYIVNEFYDSGCFPTYSKDLFCGENWDEVVSFVKKHYSEYDASKYIGWCGGVYLNVYRFTGTQKILLKKYNIHEFKTNRYNRYKKKQGERSEEQEQEQENEDDCHIKQMGKNVSKILEYIKKI